LTFPSTIEMLAPLADVLSSEMIGAASFDLAAAAFAPDCVAKGRTAE